MDILEELLMLGGLGVQYCLKSEKAFSAVRKVDGFPVPVKYAEFNPVYNDRDRRAKERMDELISGPANAAIKVMGTLVGDL